MPKPANINIKTFTVERFGGDEPELDPLRGDVDQQIQEWPGVDRHDALHPVAHLDARAIPVSKDGEEGSLPSPWQQVWMAEFQSVRDLLRKPRGPKIDLDGDGGLARKALDRHCDDGRVEVDGEGH